MVTGCPALTGCRGRGELLLQLLALQEHRSRPLERRLYVGTDILRTHMLFELRLSHELGWLFASATQDECASGFLQCVRDVLECLEAGGVNGGHVAQPQNDDRWQVFQLILDNRDLLGSAEQEWAMDAEDAEVVWNGLVLQDVHAAFIDI